MNIKNGMSGDEVKDLQEKLINAGYDVGSTGADGKFGANTQAAVEAYQRDHGLSVDGIAGVNTMGSLNAQTSAPSAPSAPENVSAGSGWDGISHGYSPVDYEMMTGGTQKTTKVTREPFETSSLTKDFLDQLKNIGEYGTFEQSQKAKDILSKLAGMNWDKEFTPSADTEGYKARLAEVEGAKPGTFESQYKGQIDEILQSILNTKDFSINDDANYGALYDKYKEIYTQNGQKAMRDAMGSAAGLTGGYGSSFATIAGQQAYDDYMDQLNARNAELMDLAYRMYSDKLNGQRQNLATLQGLDETDYNRYMDEYNKWLQDRGYLAGRYDTSLANDKDTYDRLYQQFLTERGYLADRYDAQYAKDMAEFQQGYSQFADNRDFVANMYNQSYNNDLGRYQYDNNFDFNAETDARDFDYQVSRDNEERYDDAFSAAYQMAQAGVPVSQRFSSILNADDVATLNDIAAKANQPSGGSGSGSGSSASQTTKKSTWDSSKSTDDDPDTWARNQDIFETMDRAVINNDEKAFDDAYKKLSADAKKAYSSSRR